MELAISIFAAVVAMLSLGWQAYEWRRSGARLKVGGLIVQEDDDPPTFLIRMTNDGRSACQVAGVILVDVGGLGQFHPAQYALEGIAELPIQLEAGHTVTLAYSASRIARALAHHDLTSRPHYLSALLGDGTFHRSKGAIEFPPSLINDSDAPIEHGFRVTRVIDGTDPKKRLHRARSAK